MYAITNAIFDLYDGERKQLFCTEVHGPFDTQNEARDYVLQVFSKKIREANPDDVARFADSVSGSVMRLEFARHVSWEEGSRIVYHSYWHDIQIVRMRR